TGRASGSSWPAQAAGATDLRLPPEVLVQLLLHARGLGTDGDGLSAHAIEPALQVCHFTIQLLLAGVELGEGHVAAPLPLAEAALADPAAAEIDLRWDCIQLALEGSAQALSPGAQLVGLCPHGLDLVRELRQALHELPLPAEQAQPL